ncbi:MAG: hypothetical protein JNK26_01685 [Candidatus Doudnabacteria bacterium]|nr:hypothetical protein [Candidatus Doudnabacteria bacterium]
MKKFLLATILTVIGFGGLLFTSAQPVAAQIQAGQQVTVCSFIGPICDALGIKNNLGGAGQTAAGLVRTWVNLGITLLFIGIILIAVYIIVKAAITYIQSQGDEGKIAEAQKAIKSVFIGIALLFVGIIGIILVLAFFGATGLLGGGDAGTCEQCVLTCTLEGTSVTACRTRCNCDTGGGAIQPTAN